MIAKFYKDQFLAAVLILCPAISLSAEQDRQEAYYEASGALIGFIVQIQNFFATCGERLKEVEAFAVHEEKWGERNPRLLRITDTARTGSRSGMSPQQLERVNAIEREARRATMAALSDLSDADARATCNDFLANMQSAEFMQFVADQVLEPYLAAERDRNSEDKKGAQ
jgi:hypothetical protein